MLGSRFRWGWSALAGQSPLQPAAFMDVYRRVRIYTHLGAMTLGLTLGWWAASTLTVVVIVAGAVLAVLHTVVRKDATWEETAIVGIIAMTVMTVATDIAEIVIIAVMAQVLVGWMFATPRAAVGLTILGTILGMAGLTAVTLWDQPGLSPTKHLIAVGAVLMLTVTIVAWIMLASGAEVRRQRLQNESYLAEKDRLLADKNRLIATVSHELRTPLAGVVGFASTLADQANEITDTERRELAGLIAESSNELAAIVEDLLVAARLESGSLGVSIERVSLDGLVADLVSPRHTLDVSGVYALGDPLRIRQIVRNLLTNASRYGGPNVRVSTRVSHQTARVVVEDDGAGVPAELADRIFEPFTRAHQRRGRTDPVGLGLAISSQLASMMDGELRYVRSGGKTSFELRLPVATLPAPTGLPLR